MSVEAFTVDGKVTIDTTPFESGIAKVTSKLSELSGSMKSMMEMGGGNWNFNGALNGLKTLKDDIAVIKQDIATMNTEFANTQGINALKTEIASLRSEIDAIKQKVNETTTQTVQRVREVKTEISAITSGTEPLVQLWSAMNGQLSEHYDVLRIYNSEIGQINAKWRETQGLVEKNTAFMKEIEVSGSNIAKYFTHETQILERNVSLLEQEAELTNLLTQKSRQNATTISQISRELSRVTNFSREVGTYFANEDKILRMSLRTLQEQDRILADKLAKSERETAFAREIAEINKLDMDIRRASANAEAEMLAFLESERGVISSITGSREKGLSVINKELSLEKEKIALIGEETALINEQNAVKEKGAVTGANGGKNKLDKMGYLPSRIGSMALTMWGFNELMDIYNNTYSHINAEGQRDYFADRIGMDTKALNGFKGEIASMQKQYQKLDMTVVGANALETASKYGVASKDLGNLTKVMAIYGSEFVKQGRSQEDSILAINDALDGELRRLKEVGIGKEELEATGLWSGKESDKTGMILALLQIADERGYTKTAQEITNLSDAIQVLEVRLAIDLAQAFHIIEPVLKETATVFIGLLTIAEKLAKVIGDLGKAFGSWLDGTFGKGTSTKFFDGITKGLGYLLAFLILYKVADRIREAVSGFSLLGGAWEKLQGKFGKTKGMDKATESMGKMGQTTGGTVSNTSAKDGLKNWGRNLAKNLGKMAEIFIEVAVAIAMAWALLKESMILIGDLGKDWEAHKSEIDSGMDFIKTYGIWILGVSAIMIYFLNGMGATPTTTAEMRNIARGGLKFAEGLAIAMGLITEAIVMLIPPMLAIALLGGTASFLGTNLDKGLEVISWIGNALHQIDLPVALFIGGFLAISLLLGSVQPLTLALAVGIASALLLVTEAIVMLIPPLGAIALLGGTASMLGEDKIQQGAVTIKMIGNVLQVLAQAIPYLLVVDLSIFGVQLVEWGNRLLSGGKDGLTTLVQDILPTIQTFISNFNDLDFSETLDTAKVQAVTTMANQIPPLFQAIQKVNNALGTSDAVGNIFGALGGSISGAIGMGLKGKLDQLYNDIKNVMDFANKLGGLGTGGNANTTAIQQTANAITQLKVKLNLFITTISSASARVQSASTRLGNALPTGFKTGSARFGSAVVSVLAKGVREIQSRYATFNNGGKALGQKLVDGFKNHKPSLKTVTSKEIDYALDELDDSKDDFYSKGKALGEELTRGYQDGADIHSPGLIARTTARELRYTMDALDTGKKMMYQGGVALGQALTNGYNSYGNLRTDVGVLASKGVSNEQIQANVKSVQGKGKGNQQTPQLTQTNINIDMSNSTVIGVQDLDNKIRQAVEKAIVSINSPNGAIGY